MANIHIYALIVITVIAISSIIGIVHHERSKKENEKYLNDPNAYMLETLDKIKVIRDFIRDNTRRTMLFPYGSGIFCPQEKNRRNRVNKNVRLVYGLGKKEDGTLTVLSLPFGEPLPEGFDLEKSEGVPVTKYEHAFLEDLTDFILDIYKTNISSNA